MALPAVLESALGKLETLLQKNKNRRTARIREQVRPIHGSLVSFRADLEWLGEMADPHLNTMMEHEWRNDMANLAYDVEDLADSMLQAVRVTRRQHNVFMGRINRLNKSIAELSLKWDPRHASVSCSQLHSSISPARDDYDPRLPVPAVEPDHHLGVDGACREKLVGLLVDGDAPLKAITLVGSAGSGKTSLAMEMYRQVEGRFECRATASVSRMPDMKKLLNHLLSQLHPNAPLQSPTPELEQLIDCVGKYLQDKRYLVVLDDIWPSSPEMECVLPMNNCGSRIIMTTRNKRLANLGFEKWLADLGCGIMYEMEPLSVAESLHSRETFLHHESYMDYWREASQGIAGRHGERPQAVPKLECTWQRIYLTYDDLSPFLKLHLALMCMFPPDYCFKRDLLIRIWKAEGFVMSRPTGETTANEILNELIDRNVILPVRHNAISQEEAWKVHDMMFDFVLHHSDEDNFLVISDTYRSRIPEKVRRLALHSCDRNPGDLICELDFDFIYSLFIFEKGSIISLHKFGSLRVLDVQCYKELTDDKLVHICKMVLLRYLSLRNTGVSKIPEEISDLKFLETLDLRETPVQELPEQVGQLQKLSDLLVGDQGHPNSCRVKMDTGYRYYGSLQTLETIHLNDAWLILEYMQHLKEVTIICPSQQSSYSQDKLCSSLKECHQLQSLKFCCGLGCSMEFLRSLKPPRDLRSFVINGGFVSLPEWIANLENLELLQIKVCQLSPGDLKALSELPRLQRLTLGLDFLLEQEMVINGFLDLERFSVDCRVPWLAFQRGAMPKLTVLELKFREGPGDERSIPSGISDLLSLEQINIFYSSWCQYSPSVNLTVQAIMSALRKHVRPVKLFINGSFYSY